MTLTKLDNNDDNFKAEIISNDQLDDEEIRTQEAGQIANEQLEDEEVRTQEFESKADDMYVDDEYNVEESNDYINNDDIINDYNDNEVHAYNQSDNNFDNSTIQHSSNKDNNFSTNQSQKQDIPMPKGYLFSEDLKLMKKVDDEVRELCYAIQVFKKFKDLDDGKEAFKIVYVDPYDKESKIIKTSSNIFTPSGMNALIQRGISIHQINIRAVQDYLMDQKSLLPTTYLFSDAGWKVLDNGDWVFESANLISKNNKYHGVNDFKVFDVSSSGSLNAWSNMYNEYIKGNTILELAVITGLTATIIPIINKEIDPALQNIICHISGASSSGKSTFANLVAGVAGSNSGNSSSSLMRSWSATHNSLTSMGGCNGVPIVLDEFGMSKFNDVNNIIFELSQGRSKGRLDQDSKLKSQKSWSTLFLSTGESNILDSAKGFNGVRARVIQLSDLKYTPSAEVADKIRNISSSNYGLIQPYFVNYLLNLDGGFIAKIKDAYQNSYDGILKDMPISKLSERFTKMLAAICSTAMLANECFGFEIDILAMNKLLIQQSSKSLIDSISDSAWNDFVGLLVQKQGRLKVDGGTNNVSNLLGKAKNKFSYYEIDVLQNQLISELNKLGYMDYRSILREWKIDGHLITREKDRNTSRGSDKVPFYSLKVDGDAMQEFYVLRNHSIEKENVDEQIESITGNQTFGQGYVDAEVDEDYTDY
ncbi:DUF927 domain-containing protein [Apilactobacillus micheneri]|uniref:DUF927 domain-containing protein n=1 Tax=Apilactobacillus micheneri TaxID=1899430 RepID=A0ABY2Z3H7_9LACO|nr:DUF927 domain-containing protein [Apilactobacillus micheneri]TPR26247.1 DUF927 domain-containing protein [Apilactobacillus micheneri]TPR27001.1 DUF927 domain-containing protein [Apilactobacillus micheneri]TPR27859.1 DUF927 domain-containing protein [Apilactobacillus micheneri]TPR31764.1 DUF927 domain-containing protein [Apilactobacillus micheneri]TPR32168.1 DUF927 domain-containing protein [Apilactobacillus micheneri]